MNVLDPSSSLDHRQAAGWLPTRPAGIAGDSSRCLLVPGNARLGGPPALTVTSWQMPAVGAIVPVSITSVLASEQGRGGRGGGGGEWWGRGRGGGLLLLLFFLRVTATTSFSWPRLTIVFRDSYGGSLASRANHCNDVLLTLVNRLEFCFLYIHFIIPFGKFGPAYLGKATKGAREEPPSPTSACWAFSCLNNPPNSDVGYRIFNVRT